MILSNGVEPIEDDLAEAKFAAMLAAAIEAVEAVVLNADVACPVAKGSKGLGNCGTLLSEEGQLFSFR